MPPYRGSAGHIHKPHSDSTGFGL